jgi:hypothetical protein
MESAHSEDDRTAEDSLIAMPEVLYPAHFVSFARRRVCIVKSGILELTKRRERYGRGRKNGGPSRGRIGGRRPKCINSVINES